MTEATDPPQVHVLLPGLQIQPEESAQLCLLEGCWIRHRYPQSSPATRAGHRRQLGYVRRFLPHRMHCSLWVTATDVNKAIQYHLRDSNPMKKLPIKRFVGILVKNIVNKMMWSNEAVQATSLPPLSINTTGPPTPVAVGTYDSPTMSYDSRGKRS